MSTAAIVGGSLAGAGIGAAGSIISGNTQADASKNAAKLQFDLGQENLDFQKQQYENTLGLLEPQYLTGIESLGSLASLLGLTPQNANTNIFSNPFGSQGGPQLPNNIPGIGPVSGDRAPIPMNAQDSSLSVPGGGINSAGGPSGPPIGGINGPVTANGSPASLTVPNPSAGPSAGGLPPGFLTQLFNNGQGFTAPTLEQAKQDPGFQFNLQTGENTLENSAAARGDLLSGNEGEALQKFGQGLAENTYNDVYNRALSNFNTNYNQFNTDRSNIFNRFATLAGMGQTSAGQLAGAGVQSGQNIGNVLSNLGSNIGADITNAGAARASGYAGIANSLSGIPGNLTNLYFLSQILNRTPGAPADGGAV